MTKPGDITFDNKMPDDETLSAYLDHELEPDEQARVERALGASADLRARCETLKRADINAKAYLSQIDNTPLSDGMADLLARMQDGQSAALPVKTAAPRNNNVPLWGAALAASIMLTIGFGAGWMQAPLPNEPEHLAYFNPASGLIDTGSALHGAFERTPSGTATRLENNAKATPAMSFQTKDGGWCREVTVDNGVAASRTLGCRQSGGAWRIIAMGQAAPQADDTYTAASGGNGDFMDRHLSALIVGLPPGAREEAHVIARHWSMPGQ